MKAFSQYRCVRLMIALVAGAVMWGTALHVGAQEASSHSPNIPLVWEEDSYLCSPIEATSAEGEAYFCAPVDPESTEEIVVWKASAHQETHGLQAKKKIDIEPEQCNKRCYFLYGVRIMCYEICF